MLDPKLNSQEKNIIFNKGTEPPFSGKYDNFFKDGTYVCRRCQIPLYTSDNKFDAHCGWPSFDQEIKGRVKRLPDADGRRTEIQCATCGAHLGHVFLGEKMTPRDTRHCVNSLSLQFIPKSKMSEIETAVFGGGCFWCGEAVFRKFKGVGSVLSGYAGGDKINPTYEEVSGGTTGHAEVIKIEFDPKIINYEIQRQINTVKQGKKVEKEVRKANDNGTTSFLRPLPGAARMYPDTDIAIVKVENELLNKVKIPELLTERITRLQKHYNLSYELAYQLVREKIDEEYFKRYNKINSGLLASLLINYNKDKKENIEFMLNALNSGKITKDVVDNIMLNLRMNKKVNLDNYKSVSYSEIEKEIKKIMKDKKDLSANAIMGILMNKYKGRVDGKKLIELVNKLSTK